MLSFLTSDIGRRILGALAIVAVLFGVYSWGHSSGYDEGHTKGQKAGYESRNAEVSHLNDNVIALSKLINDERLAEAAKIQSVQEAAANAAVATETRLQTQIRQRDKVIADYNKVVPIAVQEKCGLSIETVRAINKLIDSVNGEQNEDPNPSGTSPSASPDSAVDDGLRARPTTAEAAGRRGLDAEDGQGGSPGKDATALQETSAYGGQGIQGEGSAGLHERSAGAGS